MVLIILLLALTSSAASLITSFSSLSDHALSAGAGAFSAGQRARAVRMADEHFEYLVIGGGSGGMASARRAAAHGAKVAVVERDRLGGTCVNLGCVPKKVMFNAATIQEMIHQAAGYGFTVGDVSFDLASLKAKRDAYVKRLNGIYAGNLEKSGITSITGDACFVGPKEVRVGDKTYSGDHVLIAVGGKPTMPEIPGIELAIDSNGFFDLEAVPKRCAVIGSGYIAVELAGILQLLGSKVDLVIRGDRPLRNMEKDVVDLLVDEMKGCGVTLVQGEVASLKGILTRLVQHLGNGVPALEDAVEVVGEGVARRHLLGGVPLLTDARTKQRATPSGDGWSPYLRLAGKIPVKDGGEVAHSNPSL
jgi:NADPH-dependent 2,4-dienoyl-CoA reductase/sulfur reductase-like enzyme